MKLKNIFKTLLVVLVLMVVISCDLFGKKKITISYYDGDTLIKSVEIESGARLTPEPFTKNGYDFLGWDMNGDGKAENLPDFVNNSLTLRK